MVNSRILRGVMASALLICLSVFSTVDCCTQMPHGHAKSLGFNVTGFTLPLGMTYTDLVSVTAEFPIVSRSVAGAELLTRRLVEFALLDVLKEKGRSAGLSDHMILKILDQNTVGINYTPLNCYSALTDPEALYLVEPTNGLPCAVSDETVMGICVVPRCSITKAENLRPIEKKYLTFTGTITTTNLVLGHWHRQKWQDVLDRVADRLRSGMFGKNFKEARVTLI